MDSRKTLVLGASNNPERYAYLAVARLQKSGFSNIKAVGVKRGDVLGIPIERTFDADDNIDTITLYINPKRQVEYYDMILKAKPKRIIFNPGTENPELAKLAEEVGIKTVEACTLVMLSTGIY